MTNYIHMWQGIRKPGHIENSKEWSTNVETQTVHILLDAFLALTQYTIGKEDITEEDAANINDAAESLKEAFLETARKHNIPVWFPTADNYDY